MRQNGRFKILLIFYLVFLFSLFSIAGNIYASDAQKKKKEPLSKWSKQWLDEVVPYIITDVEKEFFISLPNEEERGKFIESFWKKRDPNLQTPVNEFKQEYYKRIAIANKFFSVSGIQGWKTDRGRIFILMGPPSEIQRNMKPMGSVFTMFSGPSEIWSYWNTSKPKLPYNVEFMFVDKFGTSQYTLENIEKLDQGTRSQLGIDSISYYFDYMEYLAEAQRNPFEKIDNIKTEVTSQASYNLIPMKSQIFYLKGSKKSTYMPILIKTRCNFLTSKKIIDDYYYSLTLIMSARNKQNQLVFERSKDFNFKYSPEEVQKSQNRDLNLQAYLNLLPDLYKLDFFVLDNYSGKIGIFKKEMSVPDFNKNDLCLSDIILFSDAEGTDEAGSDVVDQIVKSAADRFENIEELNVYFEVYNLFLKEEEGLNDFTVEYAFFQQETLIANIISRPEQTSQKDCRINTSFRLKKLKPGDYRLNVKVIDNNAKKSFAKDIHFTVTK